MGYDEIKAGSDAQTTGTSQIKSAHVAELWKDKPDATKSGDTTGKPNTPDANGTYAKDPDRVQSSVSYDATTGRLNHEVYDNKDGSKTYVDHREKTEFKMTSSQGTAEQLFYGGRLTWDSAEIDGVRRMRAFPGTTHESTMYTKDGKYFDPKANVDAVREAKMDALLIKLYDANGMKKEMTIDEIADKGIKPLEKLPPVKPSAEEKDLANGSHLSRKTTAESTETTIGKGVVVQKQIENGEVKSFTRSDDRERQKNDDLFDGYKSIKPSPAEQLEIDRMYDDARA